MFLLYFFLYGYGDHRDLHVLTHSYPTRRSSDLSLAGQAQSLSINGLEIVAAALVPCRVPAGSGLTAQRPGPRCPAPWPPETADPPADAFAPCHLPPSLPWQRHRDCRTTPRAPPFRSHRSEEHTSELQSLMRISYAV